MSKRISFRGQLADSGVDRIKLTTMKGKKGYKIVKFQGISKTPGDGDTEAILKIYKTPQTTVTATVDFSDNTLVGVNYTAQDAALQVTSETIIFDNEIFNQDIYITHFARTGGIAANYYIELEVMDISDLQATQLTLKSLRTIASR